MTSKQAGDSYVGMGHTVCPYCGNKSGDLVLLDRRMKNTFTAGENLFVGLEPDKECAALAADGYVCLVEVNNTADGDKLSLRNAERTGGIAWMKHDAFKNVFGATVPGDKPPIVFVEAGTLADLQAMTQEQPHD